MLIDRRGFSRLPPFSGHPRRAGLHSGFMVAPRDGGRAGRARTNRWRTRPASTSLPTIGQHRRITSRWLCFAARRLQPMIAKHRAHPGHRAALRPRRESSFSGRCAARSRWSWRTDWCADVCQPLEQDRPAGRGTSNDATRPWSTGGGLFARCFVRLPNLVSALGRLGLSRTAVTPCDPA